ncbi:MULTISPECIES: hypothetical protein, partial [Geobacillus thermoleovorans group]|uniref:hypothetical protein n=1 Tax=Geobacillus thermoleovorans group TaxID=1505648 RepID=UPI001F2380F0
LLTKSNGLIIMTLAVLFGFEGIGYSLGCFAPASASDSAELDSSAQGRKEADSRQQPCFVLRELIVPCNVYMGL